MSKSDAAQSFPFTEMKGSWREIGRQHGEEYRESIQWLLDRVMSKALGLHETRSAVLEWCEDRGGVIASRWPHWQDELVGLAEGAKLTLAECLAIQLRPGDGQLVSRDEGCTAFVIAPDTTANGQPFVGQTRDIDTTLLEHMFVGLFRPDFGPAILAHCVPGEIGGVGLNEHGLAICANNLYSSRPRTAWIGAPLIRRVALESHDVDDALERVQNLPCLPNGNELYMDERGHYVNIEIVGPEVAVTKGHDGIYVHANDCLAENTKMEEDHPSIAGSQGRRKTMLDMLHEHRGQITVDLCKTALGNTDGEPEPICRIASSQNPVSTVAGLIMEPTNRTLHISYGPPSDRKFSRYEIN